MIFQENKRENPKLIIGGKRGREREEMKERKDQLSLSFLVSIYSPQHVWA